MTDAILSPFLQTSITITYIHLLHTPSPPSSVADTHIFLKDIIRTSTHDKISNHCTLLVSVLPAKLLSHYNLKPHASPHFINTVLHYFCLHVMNGIKWHFYTNISPKLLGGRMSVSCNCHFYTDISPKLFNGGLSFSCNCHFYTDISPILHDGGSPFSCKCHFYTDISPTLYDGGLSFSCNCHFYTDISPILLDGRIPFSCNCHFYTVVSPKLLDGGFSFPCKCHFYTWMDPKFSGLVPPSAQQLC